MNFLHLHSKPTFLTSSEFNRVTKSALERDFAKCAINQSDVYLYWHQAIQANGKYVLQK